MNIKQLQEVVWSYYNQNRRSFAWRDIITPYRVFISEVMLQQTQTFRVAPKFEQFMAMFPSFEALAQADQAEVIRVWQGLGYNRRARALHQSAQIIVEKYSGILPDEPFLLDELPGIGPATAASIAAFAFNKPTVFIETNVRSVFIHHCFPHQADVSDSQLLPLVTKALNKENPRDWYYALMDYGVFLKKTLPNPSRKSKHHITQSKFEGSERQIRGMILKALLGQKLTFEGLCAAIDRDPVRIQRNLEALCVEGMVKNDKNQFFL